MNTITYRAEVTSGAFAGSVYMGTLRIPTDAIVSAEEAVRSLVSTFTGDTDMVVTVID